MSNQSSNARLKKYVALYEAAENVWAQFHDEADLYFSNQMGAAMLALKFKLDALRKR